MREIVAPQRIDPFKRFAKYVLESHANAAYHGRSL